MSERQRLSNLAHAVDRLKGMSLTEPGYGELRDAMYAEAEAAFRFLRQTLTPEQFWNELSHWSHNTFGSKSVRGPVGPLRHLAKEVQEAIESPGDLMEYVDMQFLVWDAAQRAGFSFAELFAGCTEKLAVNKARKWGAPSADQPTEHVREDGAHPTPKPHMRHD